MASVRWSQWRAARDWGQQSAVAPEGWHSAVAPVTPERQQGAGALVRQ